MTDLRFTLLKEAKHLSIYSIAPVITGIGSFLLIPLFWSRLDPNDYGVIALSGVIGGIFASSLGLCLDQGLTRLYYEWAPDERPGRIFIIWVVNWLSIIILGIALLITVWLLLPYIFKDEYVYKYIMIGTLLSILGSLHILSLSLIRIKQLSALFMIYSLAQFFFDIGLKIIFVMFLDRGLIGFFIAAVISAVVMVVFSFVILLKNTKTILELKEIKEALQFSIPIIPNLLIGSLIVHLDKYILQMFLDLRTLGIYAISMNFASLVSRVHSILKLSLGPILYKYINKVGFSDLLYRIIFLHLIPLVSTYFLLSIFIDNIILLINNDKYFDIINVVPVLAVSTLLSCINPYLAPGILLSKKTKWLMVPTVINLVCTLLLIPVAVKLLGLQGLLGARVLIALFIFIVHLSVSSHLYKWSYPIGKSLVLVFLPVFIYSITNFVGSTMLIKPLIKDFISLTLFTVFIITLVLFKSKKLERTA